MIAPWLPRYFFWDPSTWSIPKLYWDAKSPEERIHAICIEIAKLVGYSDFISTKVNVNHEDIEKLQELFEKFQESGFDDYYREQVVAWIDSHMEFIYETTIEQIYFSLDDSGYLIAHVPVGWKQIRFSTPMDYADQTTYGRLCLTYAFDAELEV